MSRSISRRQRIRRRIRGKIAGTAERPRLSVFRSNAQIYAQLVNDADGITLSSVSSLAGSVKTDKLSKIESAKVVGVAIAEKAKTLGVETVVFDRGGFLYHGRIKALAEGAREGGLNF
jgi:large subunit ribosomal protein L18